MSHSFRHVAYWVVLAPLSACSTLVGLEDPIPGNPNDIGSVTAGNAGAGGTSGTSAGGSSGAAGSAGSAGTSGTGGTAGSAGTGATGGSAGSAGISGASGTSGASGASGVAGSGGTGECSDPSECPTPPPCVLATCLSGVCGTENAPTTTPIADETPDGDCFVSACDGNGSVITVVDTSDIPPITSVCKFPACTPDGMPTFTVPGSGGPCNENGGKYCSLSGDCVECANASQCPAPTNSPCVQASCSNQGVCGFAPKPDGLACTGGQCSIGSCVPSSCVGLAPNCGNNNESCCSTALTLPGGTGDIFYRQCDSTHTNIDNSACSFGYPTTVTAFRLDKYEVTVGRFRKFLAAYDTWHGAGHPMANEGGNPHVSNTSTSWRSSWSAYLPSNEAEFVDASHLHCDSSPKATWVDTATGSSENLPVNCVSWIEANAFCLWDGGWLPTYAEWLYAAKGGSEERAYPWSNPSNSTAIDPSRANYYFAGAPVHPVQVGATPLGQGKWGHQDLAGNLWEWVDDGVTDPIFSGDIAQTCNDCANPNDSGYIRFVGGYFGQTAAYARTMSSAAKLPHERDSVIGFRCARVP